MRMAVPAKSSRRSDIWVRQPIQVKIAVAHPRVQRSGREGRVTESASPEGTDGTSERQKTGPYRLGVDGWANLLVGVVTVLAIANVLPKIPW